MQAEPAEVVEPGAVALVADDRVPRVGELDVTLHARGDRPELPHATNLLVVQALHHGNDHRTQICTVLSASGYEAPDLDVWSYWMDRRREP